MHVPEDDTVSNPSTNRHFADVLEVNLKRRQILGGGIGAAALAFLSGIPGFGGVREAGAAALPARPDFGGVGFESLPANTLTLGPLDDVRVAAGHRFDVLYAWGDPIGAVGVPPGQPAFKPDATNTAAEQALQSGEQHDGMHFFPFPRGANVSSTRGLLCINHEQIDIDINVAGGQPAVNADQVARLLNALGVSVVEVRLNPASGKWEVKRPSPFARRITGATPMEITGPAAGHPLLQTAADPTGTEVLGTLNNCASGRTPWGTYLTCEENWNSYFGYDAAPPADINNLRGRYGVNATGFGFEFHKHDPRFDIAANPNESNRFGWVVEIDPFNPRSKPKKRTALGRIKHENAELVVASDGRVVVYTGDDERNEYIYKFVSSGTYAPGNRGANRDLLDKGTLYVARFNDDGSGEWLPLVWGQNGLTPANGFANQAEVLIRTRQAADRVGATMMDRPEWIAVSPFDKRVYCTLTNNSRRGTNPPSSNAVDGSTVANAARPPVDGANPRANNQTGHIIRWAEAGGDNTALTFQWDIFILAGDPAVTPGSTNDPNVDLFNSPDGLAFDRTGRLWIQTDATNSSSSFAPGGVNERIGNNQMLVADPVNRIVRRFLTGPRGCEITGVDFTPDLKTMFVNIQHPGEGAGFANPVAISTWPDGVGAQRPRSATIVITREDGGVIGGL